MFRLDVCDAMVSYLTLLRQTHQPTSLSNLLSLRLVSLYPFAVGPSDGGGTPGDHRAHLRHRPSALEVPCLEVGEHAQSREDVQCSMHRVQVVAKPIQRFLLKSRISRVIFEGNGRMSGECRKRGKGPKGIGPRQRQQLQLLSLSSH